MIPITRDRMGTRGGFGVWAALAVACLPVPTPSLGQQPPVQVAVMQPAAALAALAGGDENMAAVVITAAFRENYAAYSRADRQVLLDGLERIARGESGGNDVAVTRSVTTAFSIMTSLALDSAIQAPERREVPVRMLRIFRQSQRQDARTLAISTLGHLVSRYPDSGPEIVTTLVRVATDTVVPGGVHPQAGLDALRSAGSTGLPVLRRLNDEGAVRDPQSKVYLRELARRGFPREAVGPALPRNP